MRHHRHGGRKQTQRSSHHQKLYSHSADLLDSRGIIPSAVDSKPLRNDAELEGQPLYGDDSATGEWLQVVNAARIPSRSCRASEILVLFAASAVLVGRNPTRITAGKTTLSRVSRTCEFWTHFASVGAVLVSGSRS